MLEYEKKAVVTHDDGSQSAEFNMDFLLDQKAVDLTEDENGDLYISGYASDFEVDRQDEAFEPGCFERGLKTFMETNPVMLYHHKYDHALGQFVDARIDAKGLWVKGRVDRPAPGSWAEDVFNKIKRGTIKAFSVGGIFRRRMTSNGPRIYDVDLGEISVTPFPVNPRTTFAVVAGKAFSEAPALPAEGEVAEVGGPIVSKPDPNKDVEPVTGDDAEPATEEEEAERQREEAEKEAARQEAERQEKQKEDLAALAHILGDFGERLATIVSRWEKGEVDPAEGTTEENSSSDDE
jgi:HK97 family phage prohead protease